MAARRWQKDRIWPCHRNDGKAPRRAEIGRVVEHFREQSNINGEDLAEFFAPDLAIEVEQLAAGGIGGIADVAAFTRQAMD